MYFRPNFVKNLTTPSLKEEGEARTIVRKIGNQRKKMGLSVEDKVKVVLPSWPKKFTDYICQQAFVDQLTKGKDFKVIKINR